MNAKEKRNLETRLVRMGLAGLQSNGDPSGDLVQQFADMINHWYPYENRHGEWVDRHKFIRDLLNECDADKRYEMYTAIAARPTFTPMPLQHYEDMIREKAGNFVSKRRARVTGDAPAPIHVGGNVYAQVPRPLADKVIATLSCWKCGKSAKFSDDTAAGAMIAGRRAGWTRDKAITKETCPDCTVELATEEVVALSRQESMVVTDRQECELMPYTEVMSEVESWEVEVWRL